MNIADVVPVVRLRRNTTHWSYRMPESMHCVPGALVTIPFRGREELGIVWGVHETPPAADLLTIASVVTTFPLVPQPQRWLIEWYAEKGMTSLSTALWTWMPTALRASNLPQYALKGLGYLQPIVTQTAVPPVSVVMLPARWSRTIRALTRMYGEDGTVDTFEELSATEEFWQWVRIRSGQATAVIGREGALHAPWQQAKELRIFEPEHVSYYHEQIPYLSLVEAAQYIATAGNIPVTAHTHLDPEAIGRCWPGLQTLPRIPETKQLSYVNLDHEPMLNELLVEQVRKTIQAGKQSLLLYNGHDRISKDTVNGERKQVPGVESIRKRLAKAIGLDTLPASVLVNTRVLFQDSSTNVGLCVALTLDPLLSASSFVDRLDGYADIAHLLHYDVPTVIQAHGDTHPLVTSLLAGTFAEFQSHEVEQQRATGLPPFAEYYVCSYPGTDTAASEVADLRAKLHPLLSEPWQISHPLGSAFRKKDFVHIFLYAPPGTRLPGGIRDILAKLPRPWKVQRNPWYLF